MLLKIFTLFDGAVYRETVVVSEYLQRNLNFNLLDGAVKYTGNLTDVSE